MLCLEHVDPADLSPGELTAIIRDRVENGVAVVLLDSSPGTVWSERCSRPST